MEIYLNELLEKKSKNDAKNNFKFLEMLGEGSFGRVMKAIYLPESNLVAVKEISKVSAKMQISTIKKEVSILQQLEHKNIVNFLGHIESEEKLYIMMDLIHGGTLKNLITNRSEKLNENNIRVIFRNLLEAIDYLHSREIVHRDLKLENIMIDNPNDLSTIKLIDFGVSDQTLYDDKTYKDHCGTLIYMAPEQFGGKVYNKSVDIFSCGIILYMLLNNGEHPIYVNGDTKEIYEKKLKNMIITFKNENISIIARNLITKLLHMNPFKRYTVNDALKHPWITLNKLDNIPKSYIEKFNDESRKNKLKNVLFLLTNFSY